MEKQTAVEWLFLMLNNPNNDQVFAKKLLDKAKEMEKEQQGYNEEERMYSEEDMKESYFTAIKSTGEGWNGEYAGGNHPNIEKKFKEGFEIFIEQYKNKYMVAEIDCEKYYNSYISFVLGVLCL